MWLGEVAAWLGGAGICGEGGGMIWGRAWWAVNLDGRRGQGGVCGEGWTRVRRDEKANVGGCGELRGLNCVWVWVCAWVGDGMGQGLDSPPQPHPAYSPYVTHPDPAPPTASKAHPISTPPSYQRVRYEGSCLDVSRASDILSAVVQP